MGGFAPRLPQSVRYLVVTVIGVAVDLAIGWALTALAHIPVSVAALAGFLTAATLNYVLHERWTFAVASAPRAARRGMLYFATLAATLLVRMAVASLIQHQFALAPADAIYALVPAVGISWCVGFVLSKFVVFQVAADPTPAK